MPGRVRSPFCLYLFFLFLFLPGCGILPFDQDKEDIGWQEEIIFAEECGLDGLPCCPEEQGLPCQYGQVCCQDPNNPERNKCVDECGCGGENEYCCLNNQCQAGLACADGACMMCGGASQPCCDTPEEQCQAGLICHNRQCLFCGKEGSPCCEGETACENQDLKDKQRTGCIDGVCVKCGSHSAVICAGDPICNQGNIVNSGKCIACGAFNQPCCNESAGVDYQCLPGSGLSCQLGFCNK